jgi:hypothetical protein
VATI